MSKLLSVPYLTSFIIVLVIFFSLWIGRDLARQPAVFNFLLILSGVIFFSVALGIWRKKHWFYIIGFLLNLIFTTLSGALVIFTINQPCEGLGCLGIVYAFILFWIIATITLVTSPFLWFYWRSEKKIGEDPVKLHAKREAMVIGAFLGLFWLASIGGSYYYYHLQSAEGRAIREKSLLEFKQKADAVFPNYIPKGWKIQTEYADSEGFKIFYNLGEGYSSASLVEIANFGNPQLLDPTRFHHESSIPFQENVLIGNKKGIYFITNGNSLSKGQSLWWSSKNLDFQLGVTSHSGQLILKEEFIKIAESINES